MPHQLSKPEVRAKTLFERLHCVDIAPNDGTQNARTLPLSATGLGVSLFKDGCLYYDNPKEKRPKCYKRIRPDYKWNDDFIEVKGEIGGKHWDKLNLHSLNDQLRVSLLRARISGIAELQPVAYDFLTVKEKRIATESLKEFPQSPPNARLYLRWDQLLSVIESPDDNFEEVETDFGNLRLPLKLLNANFKQGEAKLYLLDWRTMDKWQRLLQ